jgi:hypothetical protein
MLDPCPLAAARAEMRAGVESFAGGPASCDDRGPTGGEIAVRARLLALQLERIHHVTKAGTSPAILNAVSPRAVLVSVGAGNRYRHPDLG